MAAQPSYAKGPDAPFLNLTLSAALARTAARIPDREALVVTHQAIRLTWREFDAAVTRVANGLIALGLGAEDRVGVWSANCAEWILLQYACARVGIVLVNVNPAYRSHDLAFVLRKSRMKALFLWARDARADYDEILAAARSAEDCLEHVVHFGTAEWESMLEAGRHWNGEGPEPNDVTNIQYTSGTTGTPKGVLLTHWSLVNNAYYTGLWMQLTEQDRFCSPLPLYHCGGSICWALNAVIHGATIVIPSAGFDARATLQQIEQERVTVLGGVPTMFIAMLQHPEFDRFDLSSLRLALMGGAPCAPEVVHQLRERMRCEAGVVYGQTESAPLITTTPLYESASTRVTTVGVALPNTEVKVVTGDSTEPVDRGVLGEICVRGYMTMAGYDQEPEATARTLDTAGWLHTGDLGCMRDDGHVEIRGRAKEMIIRGGENIFPAEIEAFLSTHPKVAEICVFGLPHPVLGEIVGAWVRLRAGETATADELRAFCADKIAHYKVPAHFRFVESFPLTVSGKIQKFRVRELELEQTKRAAAGAAN